MQDVTLFQYCPKIVLFSEDYESVLLARRANEADYDGVFSFIGGKTEATDGDLFKGLKREKNEEIGEAAKIAVCWRISCWQEWFQKSNGQCLVLPHHAAVFKGGEITLNPQEYAEYRWVPLAELDALTPRIENILVAVRNAQRLLRILEDEDFSEI